MWRIPTRIGGSSPLGFARALHTAPKVPAMVLFGAPGSGKGTYGGLLMKHFRTLKHLSIGDELRTLLKSEKLPKALLEDVHQGRMLPDRIIHDLLLESLEKAHADGYGMVLLDGFPRSASQAKFLVDVADIRLFMEIHLPDEHILAKLRGRRVCGTCGRGFNVEDVHDDVNKVYMPAILPAGADPGDAVIRCQKGGELVRRPDDEFEKAVRRLEEYHKLRPEIVPTFVDLGVHMPHNVCRGVKDMPQLIKNVEARLGKDLTASRVDAP